MSTFQLTLFACQALTRTEFFLEDPALHDDPFAAGILCYDVNGQFSLQFSSDSGFDYNLQAITIPVVPLVTELERRFTSQNTLVQTFYEGPKKNKDKDDDTITWVEKEPMQVPEALQDRYNQAAIRRYKRKDRSVEKTFGGATAMKVDFIPIQSHIIIDAIENILADVSLRPSDKSKVKIDRPLKELYFAYPSILALAQRQLICTYLAAHLNFVLKVMDELFTERSRPRYRPRKRSLMNISGQSLLKTS